MYLNKLLEITKNISKKLTKEDPLKLFTKEKKNIQGIIEKVKILEMLEDKTFNKSYMNFENKKQVEFLNLFQSENCVLFCMFLPKNFIYQIHDHPQMMVFSKILEGEINFENFSFKNNTFYTQKNKNGDNFEAIKNGEELLVEDDINFLSPDFNNLHSLESKTDCVVLDLVLNDYDNDRPCSHFEISEFKKNNEVVLEFIGDLC